MKKLIAFFLLAFPIYLQAQNNTLDSLLKEADRGVHDSIRIHTLNEIGFIYSESNPAKSLEYFEQVNKMAAKQNKPLMVANSDYDLGFSYLLLANYEKSLQHYLQAARGYEKLKDNKRLSNAYMSIGSVYFSNNDLKKAKDYYAQAEVIINKLNDPMRLANLYNSLGNAYDKAKNYDSALSYLTKAYNIYIKQNDDYSIVNILSNIGLTYKHQNKTEEALHYINLAMQRVKEKNFPKDVQAMMYNNLGATHSQAKQYQQAQAAFDSSIKFSVEANLSSVLMENYRNVADMYAGMKSHQKEAQYLRLYYQLKDSLFSADKKNELTQLDADYRIEKKNAELSKTEAESVKRKSQRNIFVIIAIAAALLLVGLAFFYSRIRKKNATLNAQNETINAQNTELQTLNSVKDRLFSIISHDLRNPLVTLQSYLTLANNKNLSEEKKEQYRLQTTNAVTQTSNMLDNLLAWANMQIKNTRATITPIDLGELVSDSKSSAEAQATQKQIIIHEDLAITSVPGDYNILSIALRNLLTNAIKFSDKEGNIWINAEKQQNNIILSVKDEGVGMTEAQVQEFKNQQQSSSAGTAGEKGTGLGLYLVQELLQKINARLEVKSEKGKGSTFNIVLPA
ncbi:MAG: sensor histidine kinase [Sphingobacteriales bacterium]|nr:MAG: sensor histidine kinase [Sphingobacteriales bacterium]